MSKKYKSDPLRSIHLAMGGLNKVGALSDEKMKEFDQQCLADGGVVGLSPGDAPRIMGTDEPHHAAAKKRKKR